MTPVVSGLSKCCAVLDLIFETQPITFSPVSQFPAGCKYFSHGEYGLWDVLIFGRLSRH